MRFFTSPYVIMGTLLQLWWMHTWCGLLVWTTTQYCILSVDLAHNSIYVGKQKLSTLPAVIMTKKLPVVDSKPIGKKKTTQVKRTIKSGSSPKPPALPPVPTQPSDVPNPHINSFLTALQGNKDGLKETTETNTAVVQDTMSVSSSEGSETSDPDASKAKADNELTGKSEEAEDTTPVKSAAKAPTPTPAQNNTSTKSTPTSILRSGRAQNSPTGAGLKVSGLAPVALAHTGIIQMGHAVQKEEDCMDKTIKVYRHVLENWLIADPTVRINPIDEGSGCAPISTCAALPDNFTRLGNYFHFGGGAYQFTKKEDELAEGEKAKPHKDVWAAVSVSSSIPTEDLIRRISFEFIRTGIDGLNMMVKGCQAFDTVTNWMLFFLCNRLHMNTVKKELQAAFSAAQQALTDDNLLDEKYVGLPVPGFALRKNVPRMPGQRTRRDRRYDNMTAQAKKAFHIEHDKNDSEYFDGVIEYIKLTKELNDRLGKFVHITRCLTAEAGPSDCARLRAMQQKHTNYNLSVVACNIPEVHDLDAAAFLSSFPSSSTLSKEVGFKSGRDMLYAIRTSSGSRLFLNLLQRENGDVEAIHPNFPEHETMAAQLQKSPCAYCFYLWKELGYDDSFVSALVNKVFSTEACHAISDTRWDAVTKTVILSSDAADADALAELDGEAWMQEHPEATEGDNIHLRADSAKKFVNPEVAFPFSDELSVKTIHEKSAVAGTSHNSLQYAPDGTAVLKLGSTTPSPGSKENVISIQDEDDDLSVLTSLTKDELLARLKVSDPEFRRSLIAQPKGSAPNITYYSPHPMATPADPDETSSPATNAVDSHDGSGAGRG